MAIILAIFFLSTPFCRAGRFPSIAAHRHTRAVDHQIPSLSAFGKKASSEKRRGDEEEIRFRTGIQAVMKMMMYVLRRASGPGRAANATSNATIHCIRNVLWLQLSLLRSHHRLSCKRSPVENCIEEVCNSTGRVRLIKRQGGGMSTYSETSDAAMPG